MRRGAEPLGDKGGGEGEGDAERDATKECACDVTEHPCCDIARAAVDCPGGLCCVQPSKVCDLCCPSSEEWTVHRYGVLDAVQRRTLDEHAEATIGTPVRFHASSSSSTDGAGLEIGHHDGTTRTVPADAVIWATGYRTGVDRIEYVLDGEPLGTPPYMRPLYNHFFCATYPSLAISGAFFTSSGPMAARAAADFATWHLCVRPRISSRKLSRFVHLVERGPVREASAARHVLFSPRFWQTLITLQIDLIVPAFFLGKRPSAPSSRSWYSIGNGLSSWGYSAHWSRPRESNQ